MTKLTRPLEAVNTVDATTSNVSTTDVIITVEEVAIGNAVEHVEQSKRRTKQIKTRWHRFIRIPFILFSTVLSIYVGDLSAQRYFNVWVQTSIERTDMHVSEISFPAVTICPMRELNLPEMLYQNESDDPFVVTKQREKFDRLLEITESIMTNSAAADDLNYTDLTQFDEYSDSYLDDLFGFVNYECKDLFLYCTWRRKVVPCCSIFRRLTTVEGSCYSFNAKAPENADTTWPWSVGRSGPYSGLHVIMDRKMAKHYVRRIALIVHDYNEYLGSDVIYATEDRITIPIEPLSFTADADVLARPVEMRRCYFQNEGQFRDMSRSDCIMKCHMEYIMNRCNCTYNYELPMPIKSYEKFTDERGTLNQKASRKRRGCTFADLPCFHMHRHIFFSMSSIIEEPSNDFLLKTYDCQCYPDCKRINYKSTPNTDSYRIENNNSQIEIDVYFQQDTLFSYRSMLRFTILDLMVSFGGIAGLFLGFSMLGVLDVLVKCFSYCLRCIYKKCCGKGKKQNQSQDN